MIPTDPSAIDRDAPLYGARVKVTRAHSHLAQLDGVVGEYFHSQPYAFSTTFNPKDKSHRVAIDLEEPPITIAVIVGDCIHNLRSALDIMAVELTVEGLKREGKEMSRTKRDETGFPIAADRARFDAKFPDNTKHWPDPAKELLQLLEPFKNGGQPVSRMLWDLHQLDIIDKHHLLVPAVSIASGFSWEIGYPNGVSATGKGVQRSAVRLGPGSEEGVPLKSGDEVLTFWASDPHLKCTVGADFEVGFGENPIVEGSLNNALHTFVRAVDWVVREMAAKAF